MTEHSVTYSRARHSWRRALLTAVTGLMMVGAVALAAGCQESTLRPEQGPTPVRLEVKPDSISGWTGDTVQMEARALDEEDRPVEGVEVAWTSSDTAVATVDQDGVVTFRDSGSTTISASTGSGGSSLTASASTESKGGKPAQVDISPDSATVGVGDSVQLSATVTNSDGAKLDKQPKWKSLNEDLARVDSDGTVTGRSAGTGRIEAHRGPARDTATVEVVTGDTTSPDSTTIPAMPAQIAVTEDSRNDSTVSYTVAWSSSEGADSYDWSAGSDSGAWSESGTVSDTNVSFTPPRSASPDSSYACVAAENDAGSSENRCTAFTVPATSTSSNAGSLQVSTSTTGDSVDADGYTVSVDGGSGQTVGINGSVTFADISAEDHTVELSGVASNCSVSGTNPRTVSVVESDTVSTTFEVGCTADSVTASGQVVVDPGRPSWLMYEGGAPFVMAGPGDPEGFLYRGSRNSDGTRDGDQLELIDKLGGTAANSIYLMAVRSHGGDGGSTENPFLDSTPGNGLNQDILDQWETWFTEMEKRGITIFFIFYDDSSNPWGDGGNDSLSQEEKEFVQAMADNFTHHENLIWAAAEEYSEAFSQARISNFAAYLRSVDPNDHPIAVHQHAGTTSDFADDPNVDIHAMQLHSGDVGSLHADVQQARDNAAGRYHVGMYEWGKGGSGTPHGSLSDSEVRQANWASIMGGATVMDYGMDIDSTPLTQLEQAGYIVSFSERTDIHRMSPDDSRAYGSTEWVLADDPDSYVLYTRQGGSDPGLTNLDAGTYDLLWLDTVTGTTVRQSGVDVAGGNATWTPPSDIGTELALYVKKN